MAYKYGRLPAQFPGAIRDLTYYVAGSLPKAPPSVAVPSYGSWGMLGNNQYGNCVVEGTTVQVSGCKAAYKLPYNGPIIDIVLASGKVLSVTPNHAVLTPGGFTRAKFIHKGDDLVGGRFVERRNGPGDFNLDKLPTRIEEVVGALDGFFASRFVPGAVDFHGDEMFVNGDVNVVTANSFLRSKLHPALGEPKTKQQVIPTRELEGALHGGGAALQRHRVGRTPPFGGIGRRGDGAPLVGRQPSMHDVHVFTNRSRYDSLTYQQGNKTFVGNPEFFRYPSGRDARNVLGDRLLNIFSSEHLGVQPLASEALCVRRRPGWYASSVQPPVDGGTTDPHLFGKLTKCFPGQVALDKVVDVNVRSLRGHVYDLSNDSQWYSANDIIIHNCGVAGLQHLLEANSVEVHESESWPTDQQAVDYYLKYTGGQDSGVVLSQYLSYVHQNGYYGHKVAAYAPVAVHDVPTLQAAIFAYGGAYCGITVTSDMEQAFGAGQPWTSTTIGGTVEGGHCVPLLGFDDQYVYCCTWGQIQPISYPAWHSISDEAWAVLSGEFVAHNGDGRGVNLAALQADIGSLST